MSEWIPSRPIVGFNADGSPVTVDSWNDHPKARLRLTDAEREAVDMTIDLLNGVEDVSAGASSRADAAAATLRGLLDRFK